MAAPESPLADTEIILGNSNPKFSGVTSTMLQVLRVQQDLVNVAVMGPHHLPENVRSLSFYEAASLCRKPHPDGCSRVFHARRNNEVIQALILSRIMRCRLRIVFTATAQRNPSWITRWLIKQCHGILTTSQAANQYIEGGADEIIPHGIDLETYHPAEDKQALWDEFGFPGKRGIGIFGRVRHQKGVDVLVDAVLPLLGKHPDFTVIVCGETTPDQVGFQKELENKINAAGHSDRVVFLGKQPFEKIPKLFRTMSIVTALSRNEGFGLTVPEAMASGTAVLASEAGAWKEVVRDGTDGFVIPCGDVAATRTKLDALMSSPDQLITMGQAGRKRVEQDYDLKREAKQITEFLTSIRHKKFCLSRGARENL
ncbi:MAG: glycosyltransferase family 4 protein [Akkermansiaceae bacterium]